MDGTPSFCGISEKNILTIPRDISFLWVKFLEISEGRSAQDSLCIRKTDELPEYVMKRQKKNLLDCVALDGFSLLCFFADETVKKVELSHITRIEGVEKILKNEALFRTCGIGPGGYCATFNDSIDIPSYVLYREGSRIPLKYKDFMTFVTANIVDTQESCEMLNCSGQNLSYLLKQGYLKPLKENMKGNLYLKGDIDRNRWE